MSASERASLPYCMGNADDLLKHGVLAEYVRWRTDTGSRVRFLDLFAGEPESDSAPDEIVSRIHGLKESALFEAQPEIDKGCYYGSSKLVRHLGQRFASGRIEVFGEDKDPERARRLAEDGLALLPEIPDSKDDAGRHDAYRFLSAYAEHAEARDLVLIDPFKDFLPEKSDVVVPQIRAVAERAAVLLFALNLDPYNSVGKKFDALLEQHLPEAIIMTCPPLRKSPIGGESGFYADVVLASPVLGEESYEKDALLTRLDIFAAQLGQALGLSNRSRCMLKPRIVGRR